MMVIVSYDIFESKDRSRILNLVRKTCKKYLFRLQLSVYYGELTKPLLKELVSKLKTIIDLKKDSLVVFSSLNKNNISIDFMGKKNNRTNII